MNGSISGSFWSSWFYHAQGPDTNLMPQHMPGYIRNREIFLSPDIWVASSIHTEIKRFEGSRRD